MADLDENFYDRAEAHIQLSNNQLEETANGERVSASNMFAAARFNAWISAYGRISGDQLAVDKEEIVDYFLTQYRKMLEDNIDDYIQNFDRYMKAPGS